MVTFVCEYCDTTLKKKQVEGHIRGRCFPGAVICIDCSSTFYGNDHKGHITCISEQQKHWGQFAKTKKTKQIAKEPKPSLTQQEQEDDGCEESKGHKKQKEQEDDGCEESKGHKKRDEERQGEEVSEVKGMDADEGRQWKGWKNEIKQIIRKNNSMMESERLRKKLRKVYKSKQQEQITEEQFDALLVEKLGKIKGLKQQTYYSLV